MNGTKELLKDLIDGLNKVSTKTSLVLPRILSAIGAHSSDKELESAHLDFFYVRKIRGYSGSSISIHSFG